MSPGLSPVAWSAVHEVAFTVADGLACCDLVDAIVEEAG